MTKIEFTTAKGAKIEIATKGNPDVLVSVNGIDWHSGGNIRDGYLHVSREMGAKHGLIPVPAEHAVAIAALLKARLALTDMAW